MPEETTQAVETQQPSLAEFVGYENNLVTLKLHPGIIINAFLFLISSSPAPENAPRYTDVLNIFSDLARLSQQVLDSEKPATEATTVAEPVVPTEPEPTQGKPFIEAEVVENTEPTA